MMFKKFCIFVIFISTCTNTDEIGSSALDFIDLQDDLELDFISDESTDMNSPWTTLSDVFGRKMKQANVNEQNTGADFMDSFYSSGSGLWEFEYDHYFCPKKIAECVFLSTDNVQIVAKTSTQRALQILIRNNCNGPHCCDDLNSKCSTYTGGLVKSHYLYLYGRFFFIGKAAQNDDMRKARHDAWSCFSLTNDYDIYEGVRKPMEVSTCIQSQAPYNIALIYRYGSSFQRLNVKPNGNGLPHYNWYNIYWSRDAIIWFENGEELGSIKRQEKLKGEWLIPDEPMRIKMYLAPQGNMHEDDAPIVEHRMTVFQVHYRQIPVQDELFTKGEDQTLFRRPLFFVAILCCIIGFIYAIWSWYSQVKYAKINLDGYEILLQQEHDGTHAPSE